MNEAETRAELIDPKLKACGWGVVEGSKILREYHITAGRIQSGGIRAKKLTADYVLVYKGVKLAVVEAKSDVQEVGEGVAQAKQYAEKLNLETTYSSNGKEIYQICMQTGKEGIVQNFLTPPELWNKTFPKGTVTEPVEVWRDKFNSIPYEDVGGSKPTRYYQDIAIDKVMQAIAENKNRILLTLATGTGKTFIAFQIAWKLFQSRWNQKRDGSRRPRILFLADRNILADQAYNAFSAFPEDALIRIKPSEIKKYGAVPTNGSIFFTIFQTFMTESPEGAVTPNVGYSPSNKKSSFLTSPEGAKYNSETVKPLANDNSSPNTLNFGQYPPDYFDFIIIDECHRGGANDESNWRGIMEYFSPAVQLGLTATPKRTDNIDTYRYFGEPVYIYSLKEGINDGFLTPFKVKRIQTTIDDYIYTSDDTVIEGEVELGKVYEEKDFNKVIEIKEREKKRVEIYLADANQKDKAIIFGATQLHAAVIRDLIMSSILRQNKDPFYCVRVTANDGEIGEQYLRDFQDNEKTIPTILTTSQKLSTGVDARNIRNIVLLRPINSIIEFKQIIGRGTRLFDGKEFFTIYDYVNAYHHFADPEWDGEPLEPEVCSKCGQSPCICEKKPPKPCPVCGQIPCICEKIPPETETTKKVKIKLRDGKEREIQHMISTSFWSADGTPISAEEFLHSLFGTLPDFFKSEEELRTIWSNPLTRRTLLDKLSDAGYDRDALLNLQKLINAEKSDLFDVLEYVFNSDIKPITRLERVAAAQSNIFALLDAKQKDFIEFVLTKYIETGVEELDQEKLPILLTTKYQSFTDAQTVLGDLTNVKNLFINFQKYLYQQKVA